MFREVIKGLPGGFASGPTRQNCICRNRPGLSDEDVEIPEVILREPPFAAGEFSDGWEPERLRFVVHETQLPK